MLKQLVNECVIKLEIRPDGPILIKSGMATVSGPDMAFVQVWRDGAQQVYLPGSSLKGVLRSHSERIARTLQPAAVCDPFARTPDAGAACGAVFDARKKANDPVLSRRDPPADKLNALVYHDSCLICKLFGSTWYAGRLATADAYAEGDPPGPQLRDGVGINRLTGGAAGGAKFDLEVITDGVFVTTLHVRNFELWQLGLVGFLLADLRDGLIRIGSGKSRGLGKVIGAVRETQIHFLGPRGPQPRNGQLALRGMGALADASAYGASPSDEVEIPFSPTPDAWRSNGLRAVAAWAGDSFPWKTLGALWIERAVNYTEPAAMARWRGGRGDGH